MSLDIKAMDFIHLNTPFLTRSLWEQTQYLAPLFLSWKLIYPV